MPPQLLTFAIQKRHKENGEQSARSISSGLIAQPPPALQSPWRCQLINREVALAPQNSLASEPAPLAFRFIARWKIGLRGTGNCNRFCASSYQVSLRE
jgi:hypothetical protein